MKGLIIKDLLSIKRIGFILLLLAFIWAACPLFPADAAMCAIFVFFITGVFVPVMIMQSDESSHWNMYALSLPISVRTLVLSKYLLVLFVDLTGFILAAAAIVRASRLTGEMTTRDSMLLSMSVCSLTILVLSVSMPVLYRFGAEKSRLFLGASGLIPLLLFNIVSMLGIREPDPDVLRLLAYLFPVFVLIILISSILLSIRIVHSKEF